MKCEQIGVSDIRRVCCEVFSPLFLNKAGERETLLIQDLYFL